MQVILISGSNDCIKGGRDENFEINVFSLGQRFLFSSQSNEDLYWSLVELLSLPYIITDSDVICHVCQSCMSKSRKNN